MLKFIWNACWNERSNLARTIQLLVIAIPNLLAAFGYSRGVIPPFAWAGLTAILIMGVITYSIVKRAKALEDAASSRLVIKLGNGTEFRKKGRMHRGSSVWPALFIKGKIEVVGNASVHDCIVFVTKFERLDGTDFVQIPPPERLRLKWAYEDENVHSVLVTPNAPAHFGLVSAREGKTRNSSSRLIRRMQLRAFTLRSPAPIAFLLLL